MSAPPYKVIFSPPTDVDPPQNPIWTRDFIFPIQPPQIPVAFMASPTDLIFGAVGDGVADDTVAMQAWLNHIAGTCGFLPVGTFGVSNTLKINSRTTIYGAGRGVAVITRLAGFPGNHDLLQNLNLVSTPNETADNNIAIYGVCFQGISSDVVSANLLDFVGVEGLTIRDCLFQHHRSYLLAVGNSINTTIDNNEFYDWGELTAGNPTGGTALIVLSTCTRGNITNNFVHDGAGGMVCSGSYFRVAGNHIRNVLEIGIFGQPQFSVFSGNTINGVTRQYIGAAGFEMGGTNNVIDSNVVFGTGGNSIVITDGVIYTITNNILRAPGLESSFFTTASCILLLSFDRTYGVPSYTVIANNVCSFGSQPIAYGIAFSRLNGSGSDKQNNIYCVNNVLSGTNWTTAPIGFFPDVDTVVGANFMVRNNHGASDQDWSISTVNQIIKSGSSGTLTLGAAGFKPSSVEFQAVLPSNSGSLNASVGQAGWLTGWDIAGQVISSARFNFGSNCINWATNGTACYSSAKPGQLCINVTDHNGNPICAARLVSITDDGCTIEIDSSANPTLLSGGSGYAVNDTGIINGGNSDAAYKVLTVSAGVVLTFEMTFGGTGYVTAGGASTSTAGVQPGAGTGLTFNVASSSPTTNDVQVNAIYHA